ncbi:hypothetical protein HW555_010988 [Spodoptera exigua]|uniref:Regulatory protein zeste n=1 Tax=Spodoptera exigua TaxID=7107 RepID=A0A835G8M3_SPOEX|nr:hypothetical protein HW555_010988 [Spodoptera exigua]
MSQKRNRSINWDEEKKQLFRMVFKEHAQIIENKSLDTNTNRTKAKAWEQVHTKFNQLNKRPRELSQLKIQWKTMKVGARKIFNAFKRETNKTGGGTRPPTPNDTIIEIADLLNPAELLWDDNLFDFDGVVVGKVEIQNIGDRLNTQNITCIETIADVDDQASCQKFTPVTSSLIATPATPTATKMDSILVKTTEDRVIVTPMINRGTTLAKKVTKDHEGYVNSMISHSKMLKDEEHMRRMEMAEEEHAAKMKLHAIEMEIRRENLKSAILQREILESQKEHDRLLTLNKQ